MGERSGKLQIGSFVFWKRTQVAWIVFLISSGITYLGWRIAEGYYAQHAWEMFHTQAREDAERIRQRMHAYEHVLMTGEGFFEGSDSVSRAEWRRFAKKLQLQKYHPGVQGIGYSVMLRPDEVEPLVEKMRREGGMAWFDHRPKGQRKHYSAVLYLEPLDKRNMRAIGYDMYSEPTRGEAMDRSRDTGRAAVSAPVRLVQEIDADVQAGVLMFVPLYRSGAAAGTIRERRNALVGFVYSPFRMNDLIEGIMQTRARLSFSIHDTGITGKAGVLYRSKTPPSAHPRHRCSEYVDVGGRVWRIDFASTAKFDEASRNVQPVLFAAAGAVFDGMLLGVLLVLILGRDNLKEKTKALESSRSRLSTLLESSTDGIHILNTEGRLVECSDSFLQMLGYTRPEARDLSVFDWDPQMNAGNFRTTYEALLSKPVSYETRHRRKDGTVFDVELKAKPVILGEEVFVYASSRDITERKQNEEKIHHLANFDPLTALPNRFQLEERLIYLLKMAKRNGDPFAIMFLDLDRFKEINDTLGHDVGDTLLVELAGRLGSVLREGDTLARLGGDEFVLLLPDTDAKGAGAVAQKMLELIEMPVIAEHNELVVTGSIGIALYPGDGTDLQTLSKNADTAMYRSKQLGRNAYSFFTQEMQTRSARNLRISNALRNAIEREEFHLVYQPKISLHDAQITGVEALLRWHNPDLGAVMPSEFIPIAEESRQILPIGEWVLRSALVQLGKWKDLLPSLRVAINISSVQFRSQGLDKKILSILEETGVDPQRLELELTEGIAMEDPESAKVLIDLLHASGIRVSIDDFGTGYSSLSYLKKFRISNLKIDRSFVRDIMSDAEDRAIVGAVIKMASQLGIATIAEGVETSAQIDYLRKQGCDEMQGYYVSPPLLPKAFEEFVKNRESTLNTGYGLFRDFPMEQP